MMLLSTDFCILFNRNEWTVEPFETLVVIVVICYILRLAYQNEAHDFQGFFFSPNYSESQRREKELHDIFFLFPYKNEAAGVGVAKAILPMTNKIGFARITPEMMMMSTF